MIKDSSENILKKFNRNSNSKNQTYDFNEVDKSFKEIRNWSDKNNITVTFVALVRKPENIQYIFEIDLLKNFTEKYNFTLIDTSYKFEGIDFEKTKIFRSDNHGNELTHRLFAEAIKENLNLPS